MRHYYVDSGETAPRGQLYLAIPPPLGLYDVTRNVRILPAIDYEDKSFKVDQKRLSGLLVQGIEKREAVEIMIKETADIKHVGFLRLKEDIITEYDRRKVLATCTLCLKTYKFNLYDVMNRETCCKCDDDYVRLNRKQIMTAYRAHIKYEERGYKANKSLYKKQGRYVCNNVQAFLTRFGYPADKDATHSIGNHGVIAWDRSITRPIVDRTSKAYKDRPECYGLIMWYDKESVCSMCYHQNDCLSKAEKDFKQALKRKHRVLGIKNNSSFRKEKVI